MRVCTQCGEEKEREEFRDRRLFCRGCEKERSRQYYETHREEYAAKYRAYYAENRSKILEGNRRYAKENRKRTRIRDTAKRLGISVFEAEKLYESMPLCCEICGIEKKVLTEDHCHSTGKHRGWLCGRCNRGLGMFGDSLVGLYRAVEYLEAQS